MTNGSYDVILNITSAVVTVNISIGGDGMVNLSLDFVNSSWYATHKTYEEILTNVDLLIEFFKKRNIQIDMMPDKDVMSNLLKLRLLLSKAFDDITNNKAIPKDIIIEINTYLTLVHYEREIYEGDGKYKLKLQPIHRDWNWIMSEIVASFIELLSDNDISRVKVCQNPDCRWFFYDETKSHTKRWCDETCGNLMKVRKFRAKQKAIQPSKEEL